MPGEICRIDGDGMTVAASGRPILDQARARAGGQKIAAAEWAKSAGIMVGSTPFDAARSRRPAVDAKSSDKKSPRGNPVMTVRSDIEIARDAKMKPIAEVGAKIGIPADALLHYGPDQGQDLLRLHQVACRPRRTAS